MWCDVMRCDVMRCDAMRCDVMWCDVIWYDVMWCGVMWCDVMWCKLIFSNGPIHERVMQLNWVYLCGAKSDALLKVWLHTARSCNHQSFACAPRYRIDVQLIWHDHEVRDEGSGQHWDGDRTSWSTVYYLGLEPVHSIQPISSYTIPIKGH